MPEKVQTPEIPAAPSDTAPVTPPTPPRRGPGHRGADVRDTVAEMAARAQEISQEAGSKMAAAMKEVIHAAAGIRQFATDSARDLVQFMVRRGQMTAVGLGDDKALSVLLGKVTTADGGKYAAWQFAAAESVLDAWQRAAKGKEPPAEVVAMFASARGVATDGKAGDAAVKVPLRVVLVGVSEG